MLLTILLYVSIYLAFGFLIATPLIVWITKDKFNEDNIGLVILISILFPIILIVIMGEWLYDGLIQALCWYLKLLKRLSS
jgi:hypothetical protein